MATATAPKPSPTLEVTIKTAVKAWVKAEQSAIWNLIRAVYRGLEGVYGPDKDTRAGSLKTWINQAFEEEYGPGAAKDRAAHISKIFKIAMNAKPKDFDRWQKAGTGFYKAYEEFAVPQQNPKDKKKPETVEVPATPAAGAGTAVPAGSGDVDADVGKTTTPPKEPTKILGAPIFTDESLAEMAQIWADRIDENKKIWSRLIERLTQPKKMILTPDMVAEIFTAISKKPALLANTIGVLMRTNWIAKEVTDYIKDNPMTTKAVVEGAKK